MATTLFDKIWDAHVVSNIKDGPQVLYIDKQLIHEVTSPQAFKELEDRNLPLFRPDQIIATVDHAIPTRDQHLPIKEPLARAQVEKLGENCQKYGVTYYGLNHPNQGIVHVIGPELGITQPGMTMVCGDSHTSTHGAFGAIAFGIGTSQVAQVFASQCLLLDKPKRMRVTVNGKLKPNVLPKDVVLYIISKLGTAGGTGHFVEFAGEVFENMSMEGRMTVCNMSIEMGSRGGLIAPDETTFAYVKGRKFAQNYDQDLAYWKTLKTDPGSVFDKEYTFDGADIGPMVTYGTNPGMGIKVTDTIPSAQSDSDEKALKYMGFEAGQAIEGTAISHVFIGSCTNSRIEDFRIAADYLNGKTKSDDVTALVVPGSQQVLQQIKAEGLDQIFKAANFEIREPGCSACLAMNDDKIPSGSYCVSTSNRNFEGRQGQGARTILASPLMAIAAAVQGKIINPQ